MALRLTCAVPGCRHTRGQRKGEQPIREGEEWVCGEHWGLVPKWMRAVKSRAFRRAKRSYAPATVNAAIRIWNRCKREAVERGMGIR